jgi:NADH-quinone oxidoreductase subunit L
MTIPLTLLAVCAVLLGFLGTPAWPWFQGFLDGESVHLAAAELFSAGTLFTMALSTVVALAGLGFGWLVYGRAPSLGKGPDPVEALRPDVFNVLHRKFYVDEIYEWGIVRLHAGWARACAWFDWAVAEGGTQLLGLAVVGLSWVSRALDEYGINSGFDEGCRRFASGGGWLSRFQDGRVQRYLRVLGVAAAALVLALLWGCRRV